MELLHFISALFYWYSIQASALTVKPSQIISNVHVSEKLNYTCSNVDITSRYGVFTSPNYPKPYPKHVSCNWHIHGNIGDTITITLDDLDIEESGDCDNPPCCIYNWLKIGPYVNASESRLCKHNVPYYFTASTKVWIKFHISSFVRGGRGFRIYYTVDSKSQENCKDGDMRCTNGECVPPNSRCNGVKDCADGSDEYHCSSMCRSGRSCITTFHCYESSQLCDGVADCSDSSDEVDCGFCSANLTHCGSGSAHCYDPHTQRCNRVLDCPNGEDENNCVRMCPDKIMCSSGLGCYNMKDRCNGVAQCSDSSDEKNCGPNVCNYKNGGFLCNNGLCIREVWMCDRTNDCGDGSDEDGCLRNSVLTAAITGSLICALLLVIAISCMCRLHALRSLEHRLAARETPLSRMSREFFFREPPPSYAVAVGPNCVENSHYAPRRPRRSHRRHHRNALPPQPNTSSNAVSEAHKDEDQKPEATELPIAGFVANCDNERLVT